MRSSFSSWITHAYLFSISFIFAGLSFISGRKLTDKPSIFKNLPKYINRRFHIITSILFMVSLYLLDLLHISIKRSDFLFISWYSSVNIHGINYLRRIIWKKEIISQKVRTVFTHNVLDSCVLFLFICDTIWITNCSIGNISIESNIF